MPVSDVSGTLLPFIAAFSAGFICSPAGVTGAFLLLPFQISVLNVTSPVANSTNLLYNIFSIPGGVYNFWRTRRLITPLAVSLISGYLPGAFLGSVFRIQVLADIGKFKFFIAIVLLYFGFRLLFSKTEKLEGDISKGLGFRKVDFTFANTRFAFSPLAVSAAAFVVGVIASAYGVGGGALMAPVLATLFGLPVKAIAGANLVGTFAGSFFGIASYSYLGYPPDIRIGVSMGVGGVFGIFLGSKFQGRLNERKLRLLLASLTLAISLKYTLESSQHLL